MKLKETNLRFFKLYREKYSPEWLTPQNETPLDLNYLHGRSGEKEASPLLESLLEGNQGDLIVDVAYSMFGIKWDKIWQTYHISYEILNNYDRTETHTTTTTSSGTVQREDSQETSSSENLERNSNSTGTVKDNTETTRHDTTSGDNSRTETRTFADRETERTITDNDRKSELTRLGGSTRSLSETTDTSTPEGNETVQESQGGNVTTREVYAFNSDAPSPTEREQTSASDLVNRTTENIHSVVSNEMTESTSFDNNKETTISSGSTSETTQERGGESVATGETTSTEINATDATESESTNTQTDVETLNNTRTDSSNITGTETDNHTETQSISIRAFGNIGVTTSQDMIRQERAIWADTFFNRVYGDLDELLTLSVYI